MCGSAKLRPKPFNIQNNSIKLGASATVDKETVANTTGTARAWAAGPAHGIGPANPAQEQVAPPPDDFNFTQHLLDTNAGRPDRIPIIDDGGTLTYGQLADRVRRMSAGLHDLGIRREERVLMIMQDTAD
ncbi:MAG: AMP-binding protein [Rhodopila sp.]